MIELFVNHVSLSSEYEPIGCAKFSREQNEILNLDGIFSTSDSYDDSTYCSSGDENVSQLTMTTDEAHFGSGEHNNSPSLTISDIHALIKGKMLCL